MIQLACMMIWYGMMYMISEIQPYQQLINDGQFMIPWASWKEDPKWFLGGAHFKKFSKWYTQIWTPTLVIDPTINILIVDLCSIISGSKTSMVGFYFLEILPQKSWTTSSWEIPPQKMGWDLGVAPWLRKPPTWRRVAPGVTVSRKFPSTSPDLHVALWQTADRTSTRKKKHGLIGIKIWV
jgi:hypothetical protein